MIKEINAKIIKEYIKEDKNTLSCFNLLIDQKYKLFNQLNIDQHVFDLKYSKNKSGPTLPIVPWYSIRKKDNSDLYHPTVLFNLENKKVFLSMQIVTDGRTAKVKKELTKNAEGMFDGKYINLRKSDKKIFSSTNSSRPNNYGIYTPLIIEITDMNDIDIIICWRKMLDDADKLMGVKTNNTEKELKATQRVTTTLSRIGQENFRKKIFKKYGVICGLCSIDFDWMLIASHIKPWKDSDDKERLSHINGVVLCRNHDRLFDKGFISFDKEGKIMISEKAKKHILLKSIYENMYLNENYFFEKTKLVIEEYMQYHRKFVFDKIDPLLKDSNNNSELHET